MKFDREYIRLVCKDLIANVQSGVSSQGWLRWSTNVVVQSTGDNVGIGTVAPTSKLEVAGQIFISSGAGLKFPDATVQASAGVPTTRTISTTAPLTGGGDLSANRTLAVSDFVAAGGSAARGTVPTPGATAGLLRFLRDDGTWTFPRQRAVTTAAFNKTDATLATVTGLTHTLVAGRTYRFRAVLFVDADATGGSKYAMGGTATATSITYHVRLLDDTTDAHTIAARQTALGGSSGQAGTTAGLAILEGVIVVNAAGTLLVQFSQNAANGTSTVLANSQFVVEDMG